MKSQQLKSVALKVSTFIVMQHILFNLRGPVLLLLVSIKKFVYYSPCEGRCGVFSYLARYF